MIAFRVIGERVMSSDVSMFVPFTRGSFALTACGALGLVDLFFSLFVPHVPC